MTAGPELSRIISELDDKSCIEMEDLDEQKHHQEGFSAQETFKKYTESLIEVIEIKGNPFLDDFSDFVSLDTRKVFDLSIVTSLRTMNELGKKKYESFKKNVLEDRIFKIDEPLKKNNLPLPKNPRHKVKSARKNREKTLEDQVQLFGRLYLSHREPDKEDFFKHEIQSFPASLSDCGKIHFPTAKSSLLESILPKTDDSQRPPHSFDCIIIDGAAIVHMLTPNDPAVKTFQEYAQRVIIPYINSQLQTCHRIDLVFDQYFSDSLKNAVREKRGSGTRWKVEPNVKLPKKWHDFLLDSQNMEELFTFLAKTIADSKFVEGTQIYVTFKSKVLTNDVPLSDFFHEEADTRMLVHLKAALENGLTSFLVRTVDTDVIIILLGKYHGIRQVCSRLNLWVRFGVGKTVKNIHINATFEHLGVKVSRALPFFHAFTGSDTTSAFKFKAKKSAWQAWKTYNSITDVFEDMKIYS